MFSLSRNLLLTSHANLKRSAAAWHCGFATSSPFIQKEVETKLSDLLATCPSKVPKLGLVSGTLNDDSTSHSIFLCSIRPQAVCWFRTPHFLLLLLLSLVL